MAGRGGRGAAIAEALQKPARPPTIGRGLLAQPVHSVSNGSSVSVASKGRGLLGSVSTANGSVNGCTLNSNNNNNCIPNISSLNLNGSSTHNAPQTPSPPSTTPSPPQTQPSIRPSQSVADSRATAQTNSSPIEPVVMRGSEGRRARMSTTQLRLSCRNDAWIQYSVRFSPDVDAKNLRARLLAQHKEQLGGSIDGFSGAILYLGKPLPNDVTRLESVRKTDGQKITITLTFVKRVRLGHPSCQPILNILFRKIMKTLQMTEVGRNFFDPSAARTIPQHKLEVWPGYVTAIKEHEGGLLLTLDVSHRVLRTQTAIDVMCVVVLNRLCVNKRSVGDQAKRGRGAFQEMVDKALVGVTVLTRYNNKTHRIDDIDWSKTPLSTFTRHGQDISFVDYYRTQYNKQIEDFEQPLLVNRKRKLQPAIGGLPEKVEFITCLIPELCYITGISDEMRTDFQVMKDVHAHTRMPPHERYRAAQQFVRNVNGNEPARQILANWGLELARDPLCEEGRILEPELVTFGQGRRLPADAHASFDNALKRQTVIRGVSLDAWVMVYPNMVSREADDFLYQMKQQCDRLGVGIQVPKKVVIDSDRPQSFIEAVKRVLSACGDMQIIVAIMGTKNETKYNAIKRLCCIEMPVPSQGVSRTTDIQYFKVIQARTLRNKARLPPVVQKIALQMNAKLGGELWTVDFPMRSTMILGVDVYHDGARSTGRSVLGFVASTNPSMTRWYSAVRVHNPGQEISEGLTILLGNAIKNYASANNKLPDRIVLFRDGVGDGRLEMSRDFEVPQMQRAFAAFGDNYSPKFAVVIVHKRINTRLYLHAGANGEKIENPPPGSIMDHTVTKRDWYDYFLVSQHVNQGTVTPTHYVVIHDSCALSPDQMQKLTYKLTYMYYNWPGTIRVPAPCQYAHKLAYQVGENLNSAVPSELLADKLFYL